MPSTRFFMESSSQTVTSNPISTGGRPQGLSWGQQLELLAVLLAGFALRLYDLVRQNIWWDEARNIDVALRSFWHIPTAPELDIHPPLYFWLLHFWSRAVGLQRGMEPMVVAYSVRFLSVAAGVVGVALVYRLARLGWNGRFGLQAGLLTATIAAVSPFWLAESQEARMYTVGFALLTGAGIALLGAHRMQANRGGTPTAAVPSLRSLLPFVVLSALALSTHYNAVFILVAWYLWWGAWALLQPRRWQRLRIIFLSGLVTALLVSPVAPIALRQIPGYENPNLTIPTLGAYLIQNWTAYLGGYAWAGALSGGDWWLWGMALLAACGLLLLWFWRLMDRGRPAAGLLSLSFLAAWLLGGLALYYVAVLDRGAFNVRYSSFVTPALYILLGIALAALGRVQRWLPVAGLLLLLVGMVPGTRADLTDSRFFREDTAGLANWLHAQAGPGDVVFVDQKYPFGFYYDRYAIDPTTTPSGDEKAPARYLFVDINTIDQRLTQWASDARRVYWVQWFESDTDPRNAVRFLFNKYGTWAGEQKFQGYWVNWWTLDPPTHFELADHYTPQVHRFPPGLETAALSLPTQPLAPGAFLPIVIRWRRTPGEIERPLKARVALYDPADARLAQDDRLLLNDRHLAPSQWHIGDRPLNVYGIRVPDDLPTGVYTLRLLVYDAETLAPLEVVDAAGNPAGQEATLGTVSVRAP